jgi:hypothetical protein
MDVLSANASSVIVLCMSMVAREGSIFFFI